MGYKDIEIPEVSTSLHIVCRLKVKNDMMMRILNDDMTAYIAQVVEKADTPDEHIHILYETNKNVGITRFRNMLKTWYVNYYDDHDVVWKNGVLNIAKVRDRRKMYCYLVKESNPTLVHYKQEMFDDFKEYAYMKPEVSMTKKISQLRDEYYLKQISLQEYLVQYRLIRKQYRRPDFYWYKEADKMREYIKDDEQISSEVRDYLDTYRPHVFSYIN